MFFIVVERTRQQSGNPILMLVLRRQKLTLLQSRVWILLNGKRKLWNVKLKFGKHEGRRSTTGQSHFRLKKSWFFFASKLVEFLKINTMEAGSRTTNARSLHNLYLCHSVEWLCLYYSANGWGFTLKLGQGLFVTRSYTSRYTAGANVENNRYCLITFTCVPLCCGLSCGRFTKANSLTAKTNRLRKKKFTHGESRSTQNAMFL